MSRAHCIYTAEVAEIFAGISVAAYCSLSGNLAVIGYPGPRQETLMCLLHRYTYRPGKEKIRYNGIVVMNSDFTLRYNLYNDIRKHNDPVV